MVFKGRFFSAKKSESSKSDGSSSPRTQSSESPRSEKKKAKSAKEEQQIGGGFGGCRQTVVKDGLKAAVVQPQQNLVKKKEVRAKEAPSSSSPVKKSPDVKEASEATSVSPILASSLGLNRIKTRSGPLPQESFFGFRGDKSLPIGASNLSRSGGGGGGGGGGDGGSSSSSASSAKKSVGKKKEVQSLSKMVAAQDNGSGNWIDNGSNCDSMSTGSAQSRDQSPSVQVRSRLQNCDSSAEKPEMGQNSSTWGHSECLRNSDVCTPETQVPFDCDTPKESESPRFQAILRVTSAPRKRFPGDIKSFSHELNSKGVRPFPFWKPRGLNNLEQVLVIIRAKFDKAKEEVDSDLATFAGDLVGILEKNAEAHPDWQEPIEDLLVLARRCAVMSPGEFWLQCEGIVQDLDDRRQELLMGTLKQLHTRMLFILTRCTRLLQFHKESGLAEDEPILGLRQSRIMHSVDKRVPASVAKDGKTFTVTGGSKAASARKFYSQEQRGMDWKRDNVVEPAHGPSPLDPVAVKGLDSPPSRDRMASWKKLPSPVVKNRSEAIPMTDEQFENKLDSLQEVTNRAESSEVDTMYAKSPELLPSKDPSIHPPASSRHQHKVSWGYWGDQQNFSDENTIICRICEEEVPTTHVEDHSRICAIADRCDQKGINVNEGLLRIADTLEKMIEYFSHKDLQNAAGSPDVTKISNSSVTEESDVPSPKLSDWSRRGSEDMLDCFPDADSSIFMDDLKGLPSMSCKTRLGLKSDQGMATSSAGSVTPRSPILTPRVSPIDTLLVGKSACSELEDIPQMNELVDIARCVANTPTDDDRAVNYLVTCLEDLRVVVDRRKFDAVTVETFGTRIEKLIREKYLQICELVDDEKGDMTSTVIDEDAPLEDDPVRSLRSSPSHAASKDRTSIDDFAIIKPISRGAFGRVFLAKKRTTGDLFAIKILKKADMIRKNAVESILAERDILISVRNPFVVRFFYSFTCRDNLYLVMEYLNGGDLYSLLRNLGCLDEDVARVYVAEIVLALEYLHSLRVVHRDLKPDNLLIAHDGHIKLTDFGLSKVGLINSTDDLSGPAVSGTTLLAEEEPQVSVSEEQRQRRQKRSAVGTPDYLAPEILLGTGHGATADWWSVGVILFELIVGIPPFNAEHPQMIFDNILNRNIPWPRVPEEMSYEAQDLIDRLLTEDPNQRLGANGASEVKQHVFFKDINWDTLARQKAAFVPTSESAFDTSYFTSRYSWNSSDDRGYADSDFEDSSDGGSISGCSSCSNGHDELIDECGGLADFDSSSDVKYSFSNFSFKNLSQLASINYDLLVKGWKDEPPSNPNTL
ncbi:hypothetical protein Syun_021937 [Stephania yunnanensis]|uniref:non-specific serine/threonine protein kinase n=1 Tax=Stephania yunnanensis TaxID=152371 RepID=A0AAP0IHB1_9MAGN